MYYVNYHTFKMKEIIIYQVPLFQVLCAINTTGKCMHLSLAVFQQFINVIQLENCQVICTSCNTGSPLSVTLQPKAGIDTAVSVRLTETNRN